MQASDLPAEAPLWLIDGLPCSLAGMPPRPQPGNAESYELHFAPDTTIEGVDHIANYKAMRDRARHASTLTIKTDFDDEVVYSSTLNEYDPVVSLEPGPYYRFEDGLWGLVTGIDEGTENSDVEGVLSLEIAYVAPLAQYDGKAAVRSVHEHRGYH